MKIKDKIEKAISKAVEAVTSGVAQEENAVQGEKTVFPKMPQVCLKAAEEAQVLLKNNGVLPLLSLIHISEPTRPY